jgi:hypothetical protein
MQCTRRHALTYPPLGAPDSDCLDVGSSTQNRSICMPINGGATGADFTVVADEGAWSRVARQGLGIVTLYPFYSCRVESEGLEGPGSVPGVVACRRL